MKSAANELLRIRAQALARTRELPKAAGSQLEILEFKLAHERYTLPAQQAHEVHELRDLTPLPCTPPFIRGIVNIRGRILPVLDLKRFFDLPERGITDLHQIILVRAPGLELGLLADIIVGVRTIPLDSLQPSLPTLTGIRADYLRGVTDERLIVLELNAILSDPKIIVQEEVES